MSFQRLALGLALTFSLLGTACTGDQSYTPIGEESEDTLCQQSEVELVDQAEVRLALDTDGKGTHSSSLSVTAFSRTSMTVESEQVIVAVPAGTTARVTVQEGLWELFTTMVFAIDYRPAGEEEWQTISVPSSAYEIFWFTEMEINGSVGKAAVSTLALCSNSEVSEEALDLSSDAFSEDYELRIRSFPFDASGDLTGEYDYSIAVELH